MVRGKLHAEAPKAFPYTPSWYTGDNIEMAFGQGETVLTPIEQAVAYSTFANGGTRYAPEVASEVVDPITGKVVKKIEPKVTGHVAISPANYSAMLRVSRASSRAGTAPPTRTSRASRPAGTWPARPGRPPTAGPRAELLVRRLRPEPQPPVRGPGRHRPGWLRRRGGRAPGAQHLRLHHDQPEITDRQDADAVEPGHARRRRRPTPRPGRRPRPRRRPAKPGATSGPARPPPPTPGGG